MLNLQFYAKLRHRWIFRIILFVASLALIVCSNSLPNLRYSSMAIANGQQVKSTLQAANNQWRQASFPVENFQTYTSGYGYRTSPVTGKRQFHSGLDIAAPLGSYIRNWWGGKVVGLSDNSACGTMISIQSGEWQHIYCHMSGYVASSSNGTYLMDREGGIQIWMGQELASGARIGRVGMTGRTTGPHLHWALKYSGQYVDPALILRAMYSQPSASIDDLHEPA